ncbi:hypothetical protein [Micromonospora psammae]|uniref:hypothetical protein n=1 Tax=Micromonospora sp. CPCC 205556 TaxID=3122398 RepID=UPI002FF30D3B
MSSPPVDPWSGQPEHGSPPGPHPYPPGGQPPPPTQAGGWPAAPQPGPHPDPQPTQAYGGFPSVQPPYGQPYGAPAAPPARKSRLPLILSLGLAGLLVLCLGGGGLAYVALSGGDDPDPVASSAPTRGATPTATAPAEETPSAEPSPEPRIRLVAPKTLAGRAKSTDPELRKLADGMVKDMKSTVRNESGAIGAFYGSPTRRNMIMVAGATGFVLDPESELDEAVEGLSGSLAVRKTSTVDPGPLGGAARCGDGRASGVSLGVCAWADQGSVGIIVMFFSTGAKAKAQFTRIRGQLEKRS